MQKIESKIISYKVVNKDKGEEIKQPNEVLPTDRVIEIIPTQSIVETIKVDMGEHVERLEVLDGKTYKIKPSNSEHAYYITINNIEVEGKLHPYELFINSKGIEHYKLLGFARLISAIFRKAGDIIFLAEELKQIYDPIGVYTSQRCYESGKRKRFNSIEAEIGDIIEEHLLYLERKNDKNKTVTITGATGATAQYNGTYTITPEAMDNELEKLAGFMGISIYNESPEIGFPPNATICPKCNHKAVVLMDGCAVCLQCGQSKCD